MTTTTETTEQTGLSVYAGDLLTALTAVLPHASKDTVRAEINAVHWRAGDGLTLTATDTYSLARDTVPVEGTGAFTFLMDRADADKLAKALRTGRIPGGLVGLEHNGEWTLTVTLPGQTFRFVDVGVGYPNVDRYLGEEPAGYELAGGQVAFNPEKLAAFAASAKAIDGKHAVIRFAFTSPHKPATVRIGETFHGVLMPVRYEF